MKSTDKTRSGVTRRAFLKTSAAGATGAAFADVATQKVNAQARPRRWDREADVVVVGAGAAGLPAAIAAREAGASVIVVEANFDVGGHAILSNANVALGGGTSLQKKYGIVDSPDLLYSDLTDWSVVQPNGFPDYRYNDRGIIRAYADESAPTYDFLVKHGVVFFDRLPDNQGAFQTGNSAPREHHVSPQDFPLVRTGKVVPPEVRRPGADGGVGYIRPLEASARTLGVTILLKHRMTAIIRENPTSGRVTGITVNAEGKTLNIRARGGVVIGTGGSTSNVNFRRIFDPRLTEEYCGVSGEPYTSQDASGEIAAMAVGASLWGTFNESSETAYHVTKPGRVGCQYNYFALIWEPTSPVFPLVRATGLVVLNYQDLIMVNKAGKRFYDETGSQFTSNNYGQIKNYVPYSWRNVGNVQFRQQNYLNAALAGLPNESVNGGGPIWAIFDAEAVKREKWTVESPYVDKPGKFFFTAASLEELAGAIDNKYQTPRMPGAALASTVARYNSFVDSGVDEDFEKINPRFKIQTPPFYAAWATPVVHDTRVGLRINGRCEVVDMQGRVIPGLYCGGESAGGFSQHGIARCAVQGRLAGMNAATARRGAQT
jgi:succinate dehydrogenase/fumarate reductase flavoprotein subunit